MPHLVLLNQCALQPKPVYPLRVKFRDGFAARKIVDILCHSPASKLEAWW